MVIKVYSVCTLEQAPLTTTQSIASSLGLNLDASTDLNALKSAISTSELFTIKFKNDHPEDSWLCFNRANNFICTLPDFKDTEHRVIIPGKMEHAVIQKNEDKLGILKQLAQYNIDDEVWLLWKELLLPQIWDVCKEYGVSFNKERDNIDKLRAKLPKSAKFTNKHGKIAMDKLEFKFQLKSPYTCEEIRQHTRQPKKLAVSKENYANEHVKDADLNDGDLNEADKENSQSNMTIPKDPLGYTQTTGTNVNDDEKEVEFKELICDQFVELLDIFQVIGNKEDNWEKHWGTLQYSKYFMKYFGTCKAEELVVVLKNDVVVNVKSKDGSCCLKKVKCIYPCIECSREVTHKSDATGEGLQCNKCNRFFHNQCMTHPVSKALYNGLTTSPDYIQILCQDCMNSKKMVEKLSTDMETMKKEVSWAAKVSNGMAQNVKKAVVDIEKTAKNNTGLIKRLPTTLRGQSAEDVKKMREDRMDRTAVITKPEMKTNNSWDIRKEFNKHFPETALKAAISTATGSVRLEFNSKESRDKVLTDWKETMFGGNKGIKAPSLKPTIGIIKGINTDESIEDIREEIEAAYPDTSVDFFKRDMKITGTIKLIFKDHESYKKAVDDGGIIICGIKYLIEQFVFKPRVIRCFTCQAYGHISKNCRAKQAVCGKCCKVGHESKDCEAPLTKGPICIHCKGPHFTGSKVCDEFKRVEDKIKSMSHGF